MTQYCGQRDSLRPGKPPPLVISAAGAFTLSAPPDLCSTLVEFSIVIVAVVVVIVGFFSTWFAGGLFLVCSLRTTSRDIYTTTFPAAAELSRTFLPLLLTLTLRF